MYHMFTSHGFVWALGIWFVATFLIWAAFVPAWVSAGTLGWMSAVTILIWAVAVSVLRSGRAPRSVAQVLYDTEHPVKRSGHAGP